MPVGTVAIYEVLNISLRVVILFVKCCEMSLMIQIFVNIVVFYDKNML